MALKLSFIVPVYNVAPYLRKCVDSLLAQDYDDYEIILVNDGSTDSCPSICDEYSQMYDVSMYDVSNKCIRVIHQKNGGLSVARNAGIKEAKGEYVCFVDSDDYWQPNVLSGLMAQIERDKLDVLRFKYQNVNEKYEVFCPNKVDPYSSDDYSVVPTDGVSFLNSRFGTACYAVMFIVKRVLLEGCVFTEGIYFEDVDWTPRMLAKADRVASIDTVVYNYLIRQGSITNAVNAGKKKKVLEDKLRLINTLKQQAADLHKSGRYNRWYQDMIAMTVIGIIGKIGGEFYEERETYLMQLLEMNVLPIKAISLKARLINLSPKLMLGLLHFKNKK